MLEWKRRLILSKNALLIGTDTMQSQQSKEDFILRKRTQITKDLKQCSLYQLLWTKA